MAELRRVIKKQKYYIVHIHQNSASMAMDAMVAKSCGCPVVIGHSHNTSCNVLWQHYLFRPVVNHFLTHRFAASKEAGVWVFGNRKDVWVVNNAVDVERFRFDEAIRGKYRKSLSLENKFVIGYVGRLHEQKNPFRWLDICKAIGAQRANVVFLLVGEGGLEQELRDYVEKLGISGQTYFLGRRDDVPEIMMAFDVFLFPSAFEGLGLVAIEAQASGLRVFVSENVPAPNLTGTQEMISLEKSNSFWAERILNSPSVADRTGAVRMIADGGYDIKTEARKLQRFYQSISEKCCNLSYK